MTLLSKEPTADEVLANIRTVATRCMQAVPVLDAEGNPTGEYRFDAANALRGFELVGKYLGIWRDRLELTNMPQSAAEIQAELAALRAKRLGDASDLV